MKKILITAISKNRAIGKNNKLLWHISEDLKHFKNLTNSYPIIMGRKTFESLPGILPNRKHIVITRDINYKNEKIEIYNSLEIAIKNQNSEKIFIIGGREIYKYSLENNLVDEIELTLIDKEFEGDTFFPKLDKKWYIKNSKKLNTEKYNLEFITYKKR